MEKFTYSQIFNFNNVATAYLQKNAKETKLKYAIEKVLERTRKAAQSYFEKLKDLELEHAAVDKDGCVLFTEEAGGRKYKFDKEALKKRDKAIEKLFNEDSEEIEAYIATEIPKDFDKQYRPFFEGFVLKEEEKLKKVG